MQGGVEQGRMFVGKEGYDVIVVAVAVVLVEGLDGKGHTVVLRVVELLS